VYDRGTTCLKILQTSSDMALPVYILDARANSGAFGWTPLYFGSDLASVVVGLNEYRFIAGTIARKRLRGENSIKVVEGHTEGCWAKRLELMTLEGIERELDVEIM
jgi:hypothetical protein